MSQHIVIHLTHCADNLTAAGMALRLGAELLAKGAQVTLLLDLEGARLADVRQPLDLATRRGRLLGDMFDHYVTAGGKMVVCPHCAAAIGLESSMLRPGASIGQDDTLAQLILDADKILDY